MAKPKPLSEKAVKDGLKKLSGWTFKSNKISAEYKCGDFREAMAFITQVAFAADKADHHPEIYNVYNKVTFKLSTHDAGGKVTKKDMDLAKEIVSLASRLPRKGKA